MLAAVFALVEIMGFPISSTNSMQILLAGTRIPAVRRLVSIIFGTNFGASSMYLQVSDCDVTITDPPRVFNGGERTNYQIDLFIENAQTGDLLKVFGNLYITTAVVIDTYTREVFVTDTGLRQNSLVTVYSNRFEWFRLVRGLNEIIYTIANPGQLDVEVFWERRDFE